MLNVMQNQKKVKAGQGKTSYGLSDKKLAQLTALRCDSQAGLHQHAVDLYNFTSQYIAHARDFARSDHKDVARNWCRFFQNSQVLEVLESFLGCGDLSRLRSELNQLQIECHPLDVPGWQTDIQAIWHCLTEILSHVTKTHSTTETVSRAGSCRPVHRNHGHDEHRP
jgi:hypothetical protein